MPRYTTVAILLHWMMALLIISTFALGLTMVAIHGVTPTKVKYYSWHKWLGVTVLALACMRLSWRLFHPAPPYPATMPTWQKQAASGLHALLYLLIFAVPVSGYFYTLSAGIPIVYLEIIPLPVLIERNAELEPALKLGHFSFNMVLLALVTLHVLAALKHHFVDRDGVLKRIRPD